MLNHLPAAAVAVAVAVKNSPLHSTTTLPSHRENVGRVIALVCCFATTRRVLEADGGGRKRSILPMKVIALLPLCLRAYFTESPQLIQNHNT